MRKLLVLSIIMVFTLLFTSCLKEKFSDFREFYGGEHKIVKMFNDRGGTSSESASFFLFAGGYSSSSSEGPMVTFYWRAKNGVDYPLTLKITQVTVKRDESVDEPLIKLKTAKQLSHTDVRIDYENPEEVASKVEHVQIICKSEHWKVELEMPASKEKLNLNK